MRSDRDGNIRGNQQSCLAFIVSLPDRILVQFSRRVSSQPTDELYFSVDGERQEYRLRPAADTILRDWSREIHILLEAAGIQFLNWCYVKDASTTQGADRAWIDDLSFIAPTDAPLNRELTCLVLDMSLEDCDLITSYASEPADLSWSVSYSNSQGGTSLQSDPDVDHNQTSCLVLGVALPDDRMIQFFLRTNSEGGNDFCISRRMVSD